MNEATLKKINEELSKDLIGQKFGKVFTLSRFETAIDFRPADSRFLFISANPVTPRIYFIQRRFKDLEKNSRNPPPFVLMVRKRLSNAILNKIEKVRNERILQFFFTVRTEFGETENYVFVVQLTGRSSNLYLLNEKNIILDSLRENTGDGQEIGDFYSAPMRPDNFKKSVKKEEVFPKGEFETVSEALDNFYLTREAEQRFKSIANSAESKLNTEIKKHEKLLKNLNRDLQKHGDADTWKRYGDLLLANVANAVREGETILVTDYYDENLPTVEIKADENQTITEVALNYFKRYTKARNAKEEITKRLAVLERETEKLNIKKEKTKKAFEEKDEEFFEQFKDDKKDTKKSKKKTKQDASKSRSFMSSDGFEILVGKGAKDNDLLTFRVAKSYDMWLHAADYHGSHTIIKNPNRLEIPPKTLVEAAQLAAFYSQAKTQPKAAVHYTQRKFVHKPKGGVAGLVNLSSFKTILVEPKML